MSSSEFTFPIILTFISVFYQDGHVLVQKLNQDGHVLVQKLKSVELRLGMDFDIRFRDANRTEECFCFGLVQPTEDILY